MRRDGTYGNWADRLAAWLRLYKLHRWLLFWKNGRRRGDPPSDPP